MFHSFPSERLATAALVILAAAFSGCADKNIPADSVSVTPRSTAGGEVTTDSARKATVASAATASAGASTGTPAGAGQDAALPAGEAAKRTHRDSIALASMTKTDSVLDKKWPVKMPAPLPGAIFPANRVVAFYGNPLVKKMGVLGEYPKDEMLAKLDREVARWAKADPGRPHAGRAVGATAGLRRMTTTDRASQVPAAKPSRSPATNRRSDNREQNPAAAAAGVHGPDLESNNGRDCEPGQCEKENAADGRNWYGHFSGV